MKKEELVSGLLWDLSPHGRLSMRAGRQYIKKKKKNKNDADDDEKEVDICGDDNCYDDRDFSPKMYTQEFDFSSLLAVKIKHQV